MGKLLNVVNHHHVRNSGTNMTTLQHAFGFFGDDAKSHVIQNLQQVPAGGNVQTAWRMLGIEICLRGYMSVFPMGH